MKEIISHRETELHKYGGSFLTARGRKISIFWANQHVNHPHTGLCFIRVWCSTLTANEYTSSCWLIVLLAAWMKPFHCKYRLNKKQHTLNGLYWDLIFHPPILWPLKVASSMMEGFAHVRHSLTSLLSVSKWFDFIFCRFIWYFMF